MGPILFLCCINDLKWVNFKGYLSLYADDSSIRVAANSVQELVKYMHHDLYLFSQWCDINKLTINVKKCKVLPYYTSRQHNFLKDQNIWMNNRTLDCVNNYTYLGIKIDSALKMQNHLQHFIILQ